jgi:hypothetical protein
MDEATTPVWAAASAGASLTPSPRNCTLRPALSGHRAATSTLRRALSARVQTVLKPLISGPSMPPDPVTPPPGSSTATGGKPCRTRRPEAPLRSHEKGNGGRRCLPAPLSRDAPRVVARPSGSALGGWRISSAVLAQKGFGSSFPGSDPVANALPRGTGRFRDHPGAQGRRLRRGPPPGPAAQRLTLGFGLGTCA